MDGWNTTFLLGRPIFRGYVSFREGIIKRGVTQCHLFLGGGFTDFLFSPLFGEDSHFDYFQMGGNHQLVFFLGGIKLDANLWSCRFEGDFPNKQCMKFGLVI